MPRKIDPSGRGLAGGRALGQDAAMKLLRDVAVRHLVTVDPRSTLRRASKVMSDRGVGCAVAVENEKVCGIITERDILHAVAAERNVDETPVEDVMTKDVVSGAPAWDIMRAVRTMTEGGFRHLLVSEMGDPVGIVSLRDLMDSMAELVQSSPDA
jgi:CBS domain-containing protein